MKRTFAIAVLMGLWILSYAQEDKITDSLYQFTEIININTTSVKNQGSSGTCWSYSALSFLETEVLRKTGNLYDLSEMFVVFNTYWEKADRYVRMHGKINFGQGGALIDVTEMYRKYGAVPQEVYEGLSYGTDINRHGELDAVLKGMLDAIIQNKNRKLTPVWKEAYRKVLETYLGQYPESFEYGGKTYTPRSFADTHLKLNADDYLQFTSWTDNEYYSNMVILVPDNWLFGKAYNIPLDHLETIVDNALRKGYSVAWAQDVSEKGFSWKHGVAYVPEKPFDDMSDEEKKQMFGGPADEMTITAEIRQQAFDNYTTTDDHGMHIVGMAKDNTGKEYYIVKNSWDTKNIFEGYIYVTKAFFNYKTISIMLHKDAVPADILKKLK